MNSTADSNVKRIQALVDFFCVRVQEKEPAFLSLEYRGGELKFFLNNADVAPHSRHNRQQRRTTAPDRRPRQRTSPQRNTRPTATHNRRAPPPPPRTSPPSATRAGPVPNATPAVTQPAPPGEPLTPVVTAVTAAATAESMANNTRAKKRKVNNRSPAATSTPEIVRAGRGLAQQDKHHVSHLDTLDRDADRDSDSDGDGGSNVEVDECDEDEESTPIECEFFSKNIYNILDVQTTPPPTVTNADASADNRSDAVASSPLPAATARHASPPPLEVCTLCIEVPKYIPKCPIHNYTRGGSIPRGHITWR